MSRETAAFLAAIAIIGLATVVVSIAATPFTGWPDDWETLVVGLGALVVAYLTLSASRKQVDAVRDQINQTAGLAAQERERDSFAARSTLALSEITQYARECLGRLYGAGVGAAPPPLPSQDVIGVLRDCIRYADDPKRSELADLLKELQKNAARLRAPAMPPTEHALDAALIYVRASSLFSYARREDDEPVQWLSSALFAVGILQGDIPALDRRFEAHRANFTARMHRYGRTVVE